MFVHALDLVRELKYLYGEEGEVTVPAKLFTFIFKETPAVDRFSTEGEDRVHLTFGSFKVIAGDK